MPRYTLCPYYIRDKDRKITCEDTYRMFDSQEDKRSWMSAYCDASWEECPYAAELSAAYEQTEKGDATALETQKTKALKKELDAMSSKLGRAETRIERMQKKIDELRAVNQSFTTVNQNLDKQKADYYKRWRAAQDLIDKGNEQINQELAKLGVIYEQRMAYLIDVYAPGKVIYEDDVEDWARDRAFALTHEYEDGRLLWQVEFEDKKKDEAKQEQIR